MEAYLIRPLFQSSPARTSSQIGKVAAAEWAMHGPGLKSTNVVIQYLSDTRLQDFDVNPNSVALHCWTILKRMVRERSGCRNDFHRKWRRLFMITRKT